MAPILTVLASVDYPRWLTVAGVVVMAAGVPLVPTNTQKSIVMTAGFGLAIAGFRALLDRVTLQYTVLDLAILAYLAVSLISTLLRERSVRLLSIYPSLMRADGILTLTMYAGLAMLTSRLPAADQEIVLRCILWGAGLVALVTIAQSRGGAQWALPEGATKEVMDTTVRACGTLGNPMFLGGYAAMLLPVALWRSVEVGGLDSAMVAALLAYALGMSGARSGMIASAVGMLVAIWLHPSWTLVAYSVAALLITFAAGAAPQTHRSLLRRMGESVRDIVNPPGSGRKYIWKETLKLIRQRLQFGWGHNTMQIGNPDPNAKDLFDNPHNIPLHVTYTTGLVGLVAYACVWGVAMFHHTSLHVSVAPAAAMASVAYANPSPIAAALVTYVLWGVTGFEHIGITNVAWAFLGMAYAR